MRLVRRSAIITLALASTVAIAEAQEPAVRPIKLTGDFGFVKTGGNTDVSTLALGQKLELPAGERFTIVQTFNWVYGKTDGVETSNQLLSGIRGDYALSTRVSLFGGVNYSYNLFSGVKRRFEELLGVSVKVVDAPKDILIIDGGLSFNQETEVLKSEADNFTAGRLAFDYKHTFKEKTYFQQTAEWLPNFKTSADYRLNAETALVAPINGLLAIKLGYLVRYRGSPPADVKKTDTTLRMGLQFSN